MDGTRTELANGALVLRSCVPLVIGKPVTGIFLIQFRHQPIAIHFRDDGCRSNRKIDAVSFVEAVLGLRETGNRAAVDENMLRRNRQGLQGKLHCANTGMIDIDPVDLINLHKSNRNSGRALPDFLIELDARLLIESFRVIDTFDLHARWKNNGGGDNRAGEWSHTDFIDSGDALDAGLP